MSTILNSDVSTESPGNCVPEGRFVSDNSSFYMSSRKKTDLLEARDQD